MGDSTKGNVRPINDVRDVIDSQKTITTSRLRVLIAPLFDQVKRQDKALKENVKTIRALNDRAQRAEQELKQSRLQNTSMRGRKDWE